MQSVTKFVKEGSSYLVMLLDPRRPLRYRHVTNYPPEYYLCMGGCRKYITAAQESFTQLSL